MTPCDCTPSNEGHDERGVQERIFREVLEVAAVDGRAGDVDAGTEKEVDVAGAGVAAEALADFAREIGVPRGGKRDASGIGGGGSPGAHADRGIGHFEARQIDGGHGAREHVVDAAEQLDFLLQGELGEHGVSLGLDGGRVGHGRLGRGWKPRAERSEDNARRRRKNERVAINMIFHNAPQ